MTATQREVRAWLLSAANHPSATEEEREVFGRAAVLMSGGGVDPRRSDDNDGA